MREVENLLAWMVMLTGQPDCEKKQIKKQGTIMEANLLKFCLKKGKRLGIHVYKMI